MNSRPSVIQKVIEYTEPRPTTHANFEKPDTIQATTSAAIEGLYMLGPTGAFTNAAAAYTGLLVQDKTNKLTGALAGAATGAGLAAAAGHFLGPGATIPLAVMGGICGAYSTLRGNNIARFRDAGAFGITFAAPFQGGAKAGVALSALVAAEFENEAVRGLVGAALGGAAGAAFGYTGQSFLNVGYSALAGAACGAFASTGGHRIGQSMRNMTEDLSHKMSKKKDPNEPDKPKSLMGRTLGVLPMAAFRQGAQSLIMGSFSPMNFAMGWGIDVTMSGYEIYRQMQEEKKQKPD